MAEERPINPWVKSVLELGPPILFFVAYLRLQDETVTVGGTDYDGFILATVAFVPILLASIAALWWLTGVISRVQVFTVIMVVFFGGLTVWFNDERFFKIKTTLVYGFFALILLVGLLRGKGWLQVLLGEAIPMREEGWLIMSRRITLALASMAVLNEIVWRTQSDQFWVTFETFAIPAILFVAFMAQLPLMERFSLEKEDGTGEDDV